MLYLSLNDNAFKCRLKIPFDEFPWKFKLYLYRVLNRNCYKTANGYSLKNFNTVIFLRDFRHNFSYLKKVTAPKLPLCLAIAKVFSQKMHYSPSPGFFFNYSTNVRLANYFQKGSGKNRIFYCLFKWCVRTWKLH